MKAISLWQPWASAIAAGAKRVETRSWQTGYRGPLAIHAAKRTVKSELGFFRCTYHWSGALASLGAGMLGSEKPLWELLPFGAIVATAELVDCRTTNSFTGDEIDLRRFPDGATSDLYSWTERQMGDFSLGRYGWVLENIVALPQPVPFKGVQGFFEVPDELLAIGKEV